MKLKLKIIATFAVIGAALFLLGAFCRLLNAPDDIMVAGGVLGLLLTVLFGPGILIFIWRKHENKTAAN
jgi:hypothetical protein